MRFEKAVRKFVKISAAAAVISGCAAGPTATAPASGTPAPAAPAVTAAALPPPSAAALAGSCSACHGPNGVSYGPATPTLAGINKDYFVETMQAFKSGKRHATVMGRIAKGYSDDEIKSMAGYFQSRKYAGHAQKVDAAKVARGKTLHQKSCEKCHEEGGRMSEDGGILAGQWMPYLTHMMEDYTTGKSKMPKKMETKVKALNTADIEALIQYYGSQK